MKKYALLLFINMATLCVFAQKEYDNWIFGNGLGLNFSGGPPTVISSAINGWDNSASISDSAGNLLFYTNGELIYNKNGTVMPNGSGIKGDTTGGQSATIVKLPGANVYYVFTLDDAFTNNYGARYTVVDMNSYGGLGDVDLSKKNVPLLMNNSEKIIPVLHADSMSIWIVIKEANNNIYRAYLFNSSGLSTTPITSSVGGVYLHPEDNLGQITVTKAGDKLASAYYKSGVVELLEFNNNLGLVTNAITIPSVNSALGVEFSPDGSKLYTTGLLTNELYQFDVSTYNQISVINSRTMVGYIPATWAYYTGGYMALGPDEKIYVVPTFSTKLGCIENPNSQGISCSYDANAVDLSPKTVDAGLVTKIGVTRAKPLSECSTPEDSLNNSTCNLSIPNAFTPNGDGKNDVFKPIAACQTNSYWMRVYNRWGGLVFETNDIDKGWDGTLTNNNQPVGTFIYYVQYFNDCSNSIQKKTGEVTLLR